MNPEQEIAEKLQKHRAEKPAEKQPVSSADIKTKTFSSEELEKISLIKEKYDNITLRMGQLHFELSALQLEKENLENSFKENRKAEVEFAQSLTTKYGKGTLNIETGMFTPSDGI